MIVITVDDIIDIAIVAVGAVFLLIVLILAIRDRIRKNKFM